MFSSLVFLNVDIIDGPHLGVVGGIFVILRYEAFINFHFTVVKVVVTILTGRFREFVRNSVGVEGTVRVVLGDWLRLGTVLCLNLLGGGRGGDPGLGHHPDLAVGHLLEGLVGDQDQGVGFAGFGSCARTNGPGVCLPVN